MRLAVMATTDQNLEMVRYWIGDLDRAVADASEKWRWPTLSSRMSFIMGLTTALSFNNIISTDDEVALKQEARDEYDRLREEYKL
ncbi:hypothetical protein QE320_gp104 [Pseudomonas phage EM]|uniref:Uncharacterized protein n=1 Tax=Pseudomonas phage EM TaxID=2936914 RepID=A0AAE9HG73_9CAUD|nr:hypothetical protein QE320_gp104 [Pseudomonas phage EM]UPW35950.1 hypothetical protein EM_165 [Pseudomonas phage EM]